MRSFDKPFRINLHVVPSTSFLEVSLDLFPVLGLDAKDFSTIPLWESIKNNDSCFLEETVEMPKFLNRYRECMEESPTIHKTIQYFKLDNTYYPLT